MNFTDEQKDAIYKKETNILVAAAAGSGKTAVLVERIIQKIIHDGVDIDKLLVVTFTNAAASEMRERVLDAIYKKMDENPDDFNLQRQINLLGKANICTIHSFCLDVIKNNFFEIDISPNFRIASEEEIVLLKQEVLDDLFESKYESEDNNFLKLTDIYTGYRGDDELKNLVLKLFEFSGSSVFPKEWLEEKVQMFNPKNKENDDFGKSIWGKILLNELKQEILDGEKTLKIVQNKMIKFIELDKFTDIINSDIENLRGFEKAIDNSWDNAFEYFLNFNLDRWPTDKKVDLSLKDEAKNVRTNVKKKINTLANQILIYNSDDAYKDIFEMYEIMCFLKDLVIEFGEEYKSQKREKNIIDFNDIEHYALKILVKKDENGNLIKTETAKKYTEKFVEIAIDEYQDSNRIQEEILSSVSNGKNLFMVGDVKQSIYKFRKACPELFLEKYENYSLDGNDKGLKIQLFKNFRSRKTILDINNNIFESIMSKSLGDIEYNKDEFLNLGANFDDSQDIKKSEVYVIDTKNINNEENNFEDIADNETDQENVDFEINQLAKEEIESKFVAKKINEMIDNKILITDKKEGKRPIKYKDIVILLRSTKLADIYERELLKNRIPVFTDGGAEYLETIEISTIMNLLKILDNPLDDIPLVAVLRSMLFRFSDNEIITIRLVNRDGKFWKSIEDALVKLEDNTLKEKLKNFKIKIENWRKQSEYLPLSELIWKIYVETGYYNYASLMPNGSLRQANLKMLFERAKDYEKTSFKGLFNFIRFIERLKVGSSDLSSAKIIGENENVVRIMSIHKSKGLEFPIVFLSNSNKKINLEDLKGDILFHKDIGIGPEYINYERRIEYSTAAKQAIKVKLKEENISEEMRVLYVALTRAKEKLIVTAVKKDEQKALDKKKEELEVYIKNNKINPILLKKYSSYLDWIELTYLKNKILEEDETFKFNIIDARDIIDKKDEIELEDKILDFSEYSYFNKLENKLNWKYKYLFKTTLPIKSTVSEIKRIKNKEVLDDNSNLSEYEQILEGEIGNQFISQEKIGLSNIVPKFLQDVKIDSAKVGTLTHLILQKIDFNKIKTKDELVDFIQELIAKNFILEEEAKRIDVEKIYKFINSDFANKIKEAKKVYKEKPFYMKIRAKDFIEEANDEEVLVQGIVDLFFENKEGKIILVDYKTDFIKVGEEENLIKKYKIQLELYKKAVEEAVSKPVSEIYLYSLYLNKEIKVQI